MSIFEILKSKYDFNRELKKISFLFEEQLAYHTYEDDLLEKTDSRSIEYIVDRHFSSWKSRGTCTCCQDMRYELRMDIILSNQKITEKNIIICLEYYENIINLFLKISKNRSCYGFNLNKFKILCSNINILLDRLNYEKHIFEEEEKVILVPKNSAATSVAEKSSKETALAIVMYRHASLKGQLEHKRRLLVAIWQEYESLFKNGIDGFSGYFDTARNMLNGCHLRHNNKTGKDKKDAIAQMSDDELELWYDELYELLLFCVLIKDNKARKDKISNFLKSVHGGM